MIGIVYINGVENCPFIDKYFMMCEKCGVEYEVIIWNRAGDERKYPNNFNVYSESSDVSCSRMKKIAPFLRYGRFVNKLIKEKKYDKLIILTTLSAMLVYRQLMRNYRNKYIFDFRDLSYEDIGLYRHMVNKLIDKSYFTCISSPGFKDVLLDAEYVMAHNFRYSDIKKNIMCKSSDGKKYVLLHIGITRGEECNKRLADIFGNDERFEVHIVGSGNDTETFVKYAAQFNNIYVQGTYNNEEKADFIQKADMLLYYYPCDFNCNRALANKYYDGLIYKKPLLGNIGTYSGRRLQEKGLGISLDLNDDRFLEKVYNYCTNFNEAVFKDAVEREFTEVLEEDARYLEKIKEFIQN